ncbi:hypothetical protein V6N12_048787 [Hibiscus sabdariffa]|uniref:Uncharacterized protein n=1 Tax=Hibiscus sabdariffa TaxID=183260 RepID=A0ABR2EJS6_9ROSI
MSLSDGAQVSNEHVNMHGVDRCEGDNPDVDETSANRGLEVEASKERKVQSQGDDTQNPLDRSDGGLYNGQPDVLDSGAMSDGQTNEVQSDVLRCPIGNAQDMVSDQRDGTVIPELFDMGNRADLDKVGLVSGLAPENVRDSTPGNVDRTLNPCWSCVESGS